jgi:hypothetical protein
MSDEKPLSAEQERDIRDDACLSWGWPDWRMIWIPRIWATLDSVRAELAEAKGQCERLLLRNSMLSDSWQVAERQIAVQSKRAEEAEAKLALLIHGTVRDALASAVPKLPRIIGEAQINIIEQLKKELAIMTKRAEEAEAKLAARSVLQDYAEAECCKARREAERDLATLRDALDGTKSPLINAADVLSVCAQREDMLPEARNEVLRWERICRQRHAHVSDALTAVASPETSGPQTPSEDTKNKTAKVGPNALDISFSALEKSALAIYRNEGCRDGEHETVLGRPLPSWDSLPEWKRDDYRTMARAALLAAAETSDCMLTRTGPTA